MASNRFELSNCYAAVYFALGGLALLGSSEAQAQIVPDDTLGTESSVVVPLDGVTSQINGGAVRGANQFHSFDEFSVPEGHGAYFAEQAGVERVFSRVTGDGASQIDGTLGVEGDADLWLINPNGVMFGENAQLDLKGSFVGTTADGVEFADGQQFSASNGGAPPLLEVNVAAPVGLQFEGQAPQMMENAARLEVAEGENLALVGGAVRSAGELVAPAGDVTVAAASVGRSGAAVTLEGDGGFGEVEWSGNSVDGADVGVFGAGDVAVGDVEAGAVQLVAADDVQLEGSELESAGEIQLLAQDTVQVRDGEADPFVALAGEDLLVEGQGKVDIFALNDGGSGLASGGDMVLRSGEAVIGDAHFWSGGDFRLEEMDGGLAGLLSPNGLTVEAAEDISLDSYQGASFHLFAGQAITIPNDIKVKRKSVIFSPLRNLTVLSGSNTATEPDTNARPTIYMESGATFNNPLNSNESKQEFKKILFSNTENEDYNSDIELGEIEINDGKVVIVNNHSATRIEKIVGKKESNSDILDGKYDIFIDSKDSLFINNIDTSSHLEMSDNSAFEFIHSRGGNITLISDEAIIFDSIDSSASITGKTADKDIQRIHLIAGGDIQLKASRISGEQITSSGKENLDWHVAESLNSVSETLDLDKKTGGKEVNNLSIYSQAYAGDISIVSQQEIGLNIIDSAATIHAKVVAKSLANSSSRSGKGGEVRDISLDSRGGNITLKSGSNIQVDELYSSSLSQLEIDVSSDANIDGSGDVLTNVQDEILKHPDPKIIAGDGGKIGNIFQSNYGGFINISASKDIIVNDIDSSAKTNLDANAYSHAKLGSVYASGGFSGGPSVTFGVENGVGFSGLGGTVKDTTIINVAGGVSLDSQSSHIHSVSTKSSSNVDLNVYSSAWAGASAISSNAGQVGKTSIQASSGAIQLTSHEGITVEQLDTRSDSSVYIAAKSESFSAKDAISKNAGHVQAVEASNTAGQINTDANQINLGEIDSSASLYKKVEIDSNSSIYGSGSTFSSDGKTLSFASAKSDNGGQLNNFTSQLAAGDLKTDSRQLKVSEDVDSSARVRIEIQLGSYANAQHLASFPAFSIASSGDAGQSGDVTVKSQAGNIDFNILEDSNLEKDIVTSSKIYLDTNVSSLSTSQTFYFADPSVSTPLPIANSKVLGPTSSSGSIEKIDVSSTGGHVKVYSGGDNLLNDIESWSELRTVLPSGSFLTSTDTIGAIGRIRAADKFSSESSERTGTFKDLKSISFGGNVDIKGNSISPENLNSSSVNISNLPESKHLDIAIGGKVEVSQKQGNLDYASAKILTNSTSDLGHSGDIFLSADSIKLDSMVFNTSVLQGGSSGAISLQAPKEIWLVNTALTSAVEPDSNGVGGNITLDGGSIILENNSFIDTATFGVNPAGKITLDSLQDILLSESSISSNTSGLGSAGDINIKAEGEITFTGNSGVSTTSLPRSTGRGGNLFIQSKKSLNIDGAVSERNRNLMILGKGKVLEVSRDNFDFSTSQDVSEDFSIIPNSKDSFLGKIPYVFIEGFIDTQGIGENIDTDVYKFHVESAGTRVFWKKISDSNVFDFLEMDMRIIDSSNNELSGGEADSGFYTFTTPGEYALKIKFLRNLGDVRDYSINLSLTDGNPVPSGLNTQTESSGNAGDISIRSPFISLSNSGKISASTSGIGNAGKIKLSSEGSEQLKINFLGNASVTALSSSEGQGGSLEIRAPESIAIEGDGKLAVEASGSGKAGDILIESPIFSLDGGAIITASATDKAKKSANTQAFQVGGSIEIHANLINLGSSKDKAELLATTAGEVDAGSIILKPHGGGKKISVNLAQQSEISASSSGTGRGGDLTVEAEEIVTIQGQGKLAAETSSSGQGGDINLQAQRVFVANDAEISATATQIGAGGSITVKAPQLAKFSNNAQLAARASGTANAGSINIEQTHQLTFRDGASAVVSSTGTGASGNLTAHAHTILLENDAQLNAKTVAGEGGDIKLTVDQLLYMRHGSSINAEAGERANGGNVTINAPNGFIVAHPFQNSDIIAKAKEGRGGVIDIAAQGVIGPEERKSSSLSDIDASSDFGDSGIVTINTPGVDPASDLAVLPEEPTETAVNDSCQVSTERDAVEYYDIGRGGLPPGPDELLSATSTPEDWMPLATAPEFAEQPAAFPAVATTVTMPITPTCQAPHTADPDHETDTTLQLAHQ